MIGHRGAVVVAVLLLAAAAAAWAITFTNTGLAATWNVMGAYATAVSQGTITFASGTPFGSRTAGADTLAFDNGAVAPGGGLGAPNINDVMRSYLVGPAGLFAADRSATELSNDLTNFAANEIVRGTLSDTDPNAVFFAVRLLEGGTDDLLVGVKANALETPAILGPNDTYVGAGLERTVAETIAEHAIFSLSRASETIAVVRILDAGQAKIDTPLGLRIQDTSGFGGQFLARGNLALTQQVIGGPYGPGYTDTNALYRGMATADTNLVVIIQDTTAGLAGPQQPSQLHAQLIAFAVRPRRNPQLRDLFGPWQIGVVRPEQGAFQGHLAFFEFRGDGTGVFDNGAPGSFHVVTPCSFVLRSDTAGGATNGDSFYEIVFTPLPGFPSATMRAYLSQNRRFLSASSSSPLRRFIMAGARRANAIDRAIAPGSSDTPIQRADLTVAMRVGAGAAPGTPTFAFSPLDTNSIRVVDFANQRSSDVAARGIQTVFGAIDITPDTTITDPEEILLTIDLSGVETAAGACSTNLIPLVYDDTEGEWVEISDTAIVERCGGVVTFRPPHFSTFGVGVSDASVLEAAGGGACLLETSLGPSSPALPALRAARDRALDTPAGRLAVLVYYAFGLGFLAIALTAFLARAYRKALSRE